MKSIFLDFIPVFCRTLISLCFFTYFRLTVLQINTFWFAPSGFLRAVYLGYTPCKAKESPVLLWFFPGAEISGIRNHFSKLRMPLPPVWNGSSGTGSRFHSGYFRMIPDASPESFLKDVFGKAYKLDMSTDYSVKVKTFAEGLAKIKDEQILCSYANSKENFIFQLALDILQKSKACQLYLKAKYFKIYVDEYQDCDVKKHIRFKISRTQIIKLCVKLLINVI